MNISGNYQFSSLAAGGNYTVTPSKSPLAPGSPGVNTIDVVATQRHFLGIAFIPAGCRLDAADVNGDSNINTIDVVAIQRFFLGQSTGIANVGKYQFAPASRGYPGTITDQTGQDFGALIFGDVAGPFADRTSGTSTTAPDSHQLPATVAAVTLPKAAIDASVTKFTTAATTTRIRRDDSLVGFQGDFTFDERVFTFQEEPVRKAGLTAGNWNVSGNVLPGKGPIRTLRVSAYSTDFVPLSGEGKLFELRMIRVGKPGQSSQLTWTGPPNDFIFIDTDLNVRKPGTVPTGNVTQQAASASARKR